MKLLKRTLSGLLLMLVAIQFSRPAKNQSAEMLPSDLNKTINVPADVQHLLKTACYDCHSNNTAYPWYSGIQPFGWFLADHIRKGKAELNFSEFGAYSPRRQKSKLNGIAGSISKGTMPLGSYMLMHKNARLSKNEKALLIAWATNAKDRFQ